jgi:3-dehydroquinate dehydratase / shikimate dehydrogenase
MSTLVCVPISVSDAHAALEDAMAARDLGADLVEFRIDAWFEGLVAQSEDADSAVLDLVARCELPSIITCRPEWEGGEYHGDEEARLELFERLLGDAAGPRYVDIELEAFKRTPGLVERLAGCRAGDGCGLIVSLHDFDRRPADLSRRLAAAYGLGLGEVVKIAYRARSLRDNLELFEILRGGHRPTIALGMGRFGLASRVLAPKFGGMLTFASLRDASATAPGQPTIADLLGGYRFRSIGPSTRVYGVVGWPIDHSMSPTIHNAGFEAANHDGVYLPLPVAGGEDAEDAWASFKATIGAWIDDPALDFAGASVTLPHKENLVRLALERGYDLDDLSRLCGAGNTLVRGRDGGWSVRNTDGPAAVDPLDEALGGIAGKTVIVLGAGGAARAVVFELALRHAIVKVCNRSAPRAERLAAEANEKLGKDIEPVRTGSLEDSLAGDSLINCTPVGMVGGPEGSPVTEAQLGSIAGLKVVEDTVYNPSETPLVKMATNQMATNRGLRAFGGVEMFVRQAGAQFQAWTGEAAPTGLFERIVKEELHRKE